MKLPAYPRTKPSGVEWLGDVPDQNFAASRLRVNQSGGASREDAKARRGEKS